MKHDEINVKPGYYRKYILLLTTFLISYSAWAQEPGQTIRGTVSSAEDGQSLIGVTVLEEGTDNGTVTDIDGNYALEVSGSNPVLLFSYVGFQTQRIPAEGRSVIDVSLAFEEELLEEVVVIGYGSVRKSDLTGAVSSVKEEDLVKAPAANPAQALQGKVSGLQVSNNGNPGENPVVRLRGITTLNNSSVLYVVDGVILDDINFLNSADIESVEVLKDASATAIFGSRGSNGVIIITTKKGVAGQEARITLRAEYGIESLAKKLDLMNGRQFATYVNAIIPGTYNNIDILPNIDWQEEVFQENTSIQNYNLSFIGASERLNYYFGGSYFRQAGIIPKSAFERITLKSNTTYKVKDFLRIGADISASLAEKENPPGVLDLTYRAWPINEPYLANGDFAEVQGGNPLAAIFYQNNTTNGVRAVGNLFLEADLLEGLMFKTSYQVDAAFFKNEAFTPEYFVSPVQQSAFSNLSKTFSEYHNWIWENTLNFNREFNDMHRIDAVIGYTAQKLYNENLVGTRRNLLREDPDFWFLDAGEQEGQTATNIASKFSILSYLFRVNYSLLDRYLFTVTFRRDGSSKFGKNNRYANFPALALGWNIDNEDFFPESNVLNELKLRASWGIIGNEKIPYDRAYSTVASGLGAVFGQNESLQPGAALAQQGNPNLQWEETMQFDIGLEASFFRARLSLETDYYRKETEGILVPLSIPAHIGIGNFQRQFFNAAEVLNDGLEFSLDWEDEAGDFTYGLGILGSTIHNEVTSLGGGSGQDSVIIGGSLGNGQNVARSVVGQSIGFFYGYRTIGVFQNIEQLNSTPHLSQQGVGDLVYADVNKDGAITDADRVAIGSWIPDFTYGFNANVGYKGISLALDFFGQQGNSVYNGKQAVRFALLNYEERFTDFWTGDGTSNTIPRASAGGINYTPSDFFIEDASFLRLRTATISYTLPATFIERFKVGSAQVYLRGTNLWTSTDYSGYLPDIPVGTATDGAIDLGVYPLTRTYMAGLNLTF